MPRQRTDNPATTWADLDECVRSWEAEKGVRVKFEVRFDARLPEGAYVEVVLYDAGITFQQHELYRVREPLRVRKHSGQVGTMLYATFRALDEMEANPWYWSTKMRREAVEGA